MRWMLTVAVSLCALVMGSCGSSDEDAVLEAYNYNERAIDDADVTAMRQTLSPEGIALIEEGLRLARDGVEKDVKKTRPWLMQLVVMLRNRVEPDRLRTMTLDQFMAWQIEAGLMVVDADYDVYPHSVAVNGNLAVLQMGVEVENDFTMRRRGRGRGAAVGTLVGVMLHKDKSIEPVEGYTWNFIKIDGLWYSDTVANADDYDAWMAELAREEGMTMPELIAWEEEDAMTSIKPNIWQPLPKKRR